MVSLPHPMAILTGTNCLCVGEVSSGAAVQARDVAVLLYPRLVQCLTLGLRHGGWGRGRVQQWRRWRLVCGRRRLTVADLLGEDWRWGLGGWGVHVAIALVAWPPSPVALSRPLATP